MRRAALTPDDNPLVRAVGRLPAARPHEAARRLRRHRPARRRRGGARASSARAVERQGRDARRPAGAGGRLRQAPKRRPHVRLLLAGNVGSDYYKVLAGAHEQTSRGRLAIRPGGRERRRAHPALDVPGPARLRAAGRGRGASCAGFAPTGSELSNVMGESHRADAPQSRVRSVSRTPSSSRSDLDTIAAELANVTTAKTDAVIAQNASAYTSSRNLFIGVAAGAIVLALLLGFVLSWSLIGPIQRIDTRLAGIASGDFSQHVDVDNRDELGALGANVNRMNDELQRALPRARGGEPAQVRVPGQHVARAANAAERDSRLLAGAARGDVRRGQREAEGVPRRHPLVGQPPALAHQRRPRPVEGRGGADRARGRAVLAPRRARARRRHGARACVQGRRPAGARDRARRSTSSRATSGGSGR